MNRFIRNVFYMGFYKIILWLFVNLIFFALVEIFIYSLEDVMNMQHKVYISDLVNMVVWFMFFIAGIYRFYIPKGSK